MEHPNGFPLELLEESTPVTPLSCQKNRERGESILSHWKGI